MIVFLVISDSHGNIDNVMRAVKTAGRVDGIIFLGDGIRDIEYIKSTLEQLNVYAVLGNCDHFSALSDYKKVESFCFEGKKIVITHGDLYGAKYGDSGLLLLAREHGADIVLYGHTHIARETQIDGVYLCNPGSIGGYSDASFGVLTLDGNNALFSYKRLEF